MIPPQYEPKGLAPDTPPLFGGSGDDDAIEGSYRLLAAILRAQGRPVPPKPEIGKPTSRAEFGPIKTRAQQRIEQLINAGRPLTEAESDELYRALHADYMKKWRDRRAARASAEMGGRVLDRHRDEEAGLLEKIEREVA